MLIFNTINIFSRLSNKTELMKVTSGAPERIILIRMYLIPHID